MGSADFTPEVKQAILHRAVGRCDRCGLRADRAHFHHRTPRRAGGTSREDLGLPSNGLLLHPKCHDWVESKRKVAAQLGFLVGYGTPPVEAPVYLWNGWHMLTDDGLAVPLPKPPPISPVNAENVNDAASSGDVLPLAALDRGKP